MIGESNEIRNKTAKIIVSRLLGSLEANPIYISQNLEELSKELKQQNSELLEALKDAKNRLSHLLPIEDPQEENDDPFETISVLCSRTSGAYEVINDAIMKYDRASKIEEVKMSIEFDIACLRCPIDVGNPMDVLQLSARASMAADQLEDLIKQRDKLLETKIKLYGWVDDANFKKNKYFAEKEKAEAKVNYLLKALNDASSTLHSSMGDVNKIMYTTTWIDQIIAEVGVGVENEKHSKN